MRHQSHLQLLPPCFRKSLPCMAPLLKYQHLSKCPCVQFFWHCETLMQTFGRIKHVLLPKWCHRAFTRNQSDSARVVCGCSKPVKPCQNYWRMAPSFDAAWSRIFHKQWWKFQISCPWGSVMGISHAVAGTTGKTNIGEIQKHCLLIGGFGIWLTRTELPEKTSATKTLCQNCKESESTASAMFWLRYLGLKVHDDFIMQCCPNGYISRFMCHTILWFVHVIHRMSTDIRSLHSSSPFC